MSGNPEFFAKLAEYPVGIGYKPVAGEVSLDEIFPEIASRMVYTIRPIASLIPAEEATAAISATQSQPAFIVIPGRRFDATGTRHGKGAGWYDRFLSGTPKEWLRIGFCYDDQFSNEPLLRQAWDEPMDAVCVVDKASGEVTIYWDNDNARLTS